MCFSRQYLKYLFIKSEMLERFIYFYENHKPRTALHIIIIQMLSELYLHDKTY